jgi:hypothetical protein
MLGVGAAPLLFVEMLASEFATLVVGNPVVVDELYRAMVIVDDVPAVTT